MSKKSIENVIIETLTGDVQKNALDFVNYLRTNDATIHDSDNYFWSTTYKDKDLCIITIGIEDKETTSFEIFFNVLPNCITSPDAIYDNSDKYVSFPVDKQKIVWESVRPCDCIDYDCKSKTDNRMIIFGKEFNNLCYCFLGMSDPDAETVDCMKRIIDARIFEILNKSNTSS